MAETEILLTVPYEVKTCHIKTSFDVERLCVI